MTDGDRTRIARYLALLVVTWMAVMTWRIYPQFKDAVRVEERVTTVDDYISATCGERLGPGAETCLAEAREEAQRLLRREQGRSVLLILAPILIYILAYAPVLLWQRRGMKGAGP